MFSLSLADCIRPQLSSPVEIDDAGKSKIVCTIQEKCSQCPSSIIMIVTTKLPNGVDYRIPVIIVPVIEMAILMTNALILLLSGAEMDDEAHFLKTTCRGPNSEEFFVFCSTLGSFLSYVINWD
ncbi:unnamed protein product [Hymenolepis diminuta]|uniref:Uncharacterized protein n=1 Tax=Hymenolepis diminuta TaxID=6216 RepID=A0A564YES0_HYMDI|nr:unnamed protein product [Hymenolepis diminuta]